MAASVEILFNLDNYDKEESLNLGKGTGTLL